MVCGGDEAGRGSVMGPLVVGAVYVEDDAFLKDIGVRDSKKLTPKSREWMYDRIVSEASDYAIVIASAADVDERRAKMSLNDVELEMFREAVSKIPVTRVYADCPDVNEMVFSSALSIRLNNITVIGRHKADDTYPVVSAASIIAKVTRDRYMADMAIKYPEWQFERHKGYGTKLHYEMIDKYGESPIHRHSFLRKYYEQHL